MMVQNCKARHSQTGTPQYTTTYFSCWMVAVNEDSIERQPFGFSLVFGRQGKASAARGTLRPGNRSGRFLWQLRQHHDKRRAISCE